MYKEALHPYLAQIMGIAPPAPESLPEGANTRYVTEEELRARAAEPDGATPSEGEDGGAPGDTTAPASGPETRSREFQPDQPPRPLRPGPPQWRLAEPIQTRWTLSPKRLACRKTRVFTP
jgi:hypothetical protein